jgi:hypothetical protein
MQTISYSFEQSQTGVYTEILRPDNVKSRDGYTDIQLVIEGIKTILHSIIKSGHDAMSDSFKDVDLEELINNILTLNISPYAGVRFTYGDPYGNTGHFFIAELKHHDGVNGWVNVLTCSLAHEPKNSSLIIEIMPHGVARETMRYFISFFENTTLFDNFKKLLITYNRMGVSPFNEAMKKIIKQYLIEPRENKLTF